MKILLPVTSAKIWSESGMLTVKITIREPDPETNIKDQCIEVSADGQDEQNCLHITSGLHCKTLSYVLKHNVRRICLNGDFLDNAEHISVPVLPARSVAQSISIVGFNASFYNYSLYIRGNDQNFANILFKNITFVSSVIHVVSMGLVVDNSVLLDSQITDKGNGTAGSHIQLAMTNSFASCNSNDMQGLVFQNMAILALELSGCEIVSCPLSLLVQNLSLSIIGSSRLHGIQASIVVRSFQKVPVIISIENAILTSNQSDTGTTAKLLFDIQNGYIHMMIRNSTFPATRFIVILKQQKFVKNDTFVLFVTKTDFQDSVVKGNGAALSITSEETASLVRLVQCTFIKNKAIRISNDFQLGYGGAMYVKGNLLQLEIKDSIFQDNTADGEGTALYTAPGVIASMTNCTFSYDMKDVPDISQAMLSVGGLLQNLEAVFSIDHKIPSSIRNQFKVFSVNGANELKMTVQCPSWYKHVSRYNIPTREFEGNQSQAIQNLVYECVACSEGFYTPSARDNHLSYTGKATLFGETLGKCEECPYGGSCSGNNIVPRANYWGYLRGQEVVFEQCPPGYCCTNNYNAPCTRYDSCAPGRQGPLCGTCKEGLSISILTGDCLPESECEENYLFWLFAISITLAYVIWYTFKGDVLAFVLYLLSLILRRMKSHFTRKQAKPSADEININPAPFSRKENQFKKDNINMSGIKNKNSKKGILDAQVKKFGSKRKSRGYFGIISFYVQMSAAMKITIEFSDIDNSKSVLDHISDHIDYVVVNIDRAFNFGFSDIALKFCPIDIALKFCPISDMTSQGQRISLMAFLLAIYVAWAVFCAVIALAWCVSRKAVMTKRYKLLNLLRIRFIGGLVEIIKYTYEGFCEVIFISLVCVEINGTYVWWDDATQTCLERWQIGMLLLGVVYALPFPFALFLSMKMLERGKISSVTFFVCCLCPLFGIIILSLQGCSKKYESKPISESKDIILYTLQGPFRQDEKNMTLYWETIISVRRLLVTGMMLLGYASIRLVFLTALCAIFLLHHAYMMPFQVQTSNHVESLSLVFLLLFTIFNLLKASLTDNGVVPVGPSVGFFKALEFTEKLFPIILVLVIVLIELRKKLKGKRKNQ